MSIDHISLLDIKDKKVLLCVSKGKTKWQLPGGKRNEGETDHQALIRECKEELSINIQSETVKHFESIVGQAFGKDNGVKVNIKIYSAKFNGVPKPTSEIDRVSYMSLDEVPDTSEMGWDYLRKLKDKGIII